MSDSNGINRSRLLWAGFMAILAAGVGFAIRGGIFGNWGGEYGFTGAQLGAIGGAGFTGFCFGIVVGGVTHVLLERRPIFAVLGEIFFGISLSVLSFSGASEVRSRI